MYIILYFNSLFLTSPVLFSKHNQIWFLKNLEYSYKLFRYINYNILIDDDKKKILNIFQFTTHI